MDAEWTARSSQQSLIITCRRVQASKLFSVCGVRRVVFEGRDSPGVPSCG